MGHGHDQRIYEPVSVVQDDPVGDILAALSVDGPLALTLFPSPRRRRKTISESHKISQKKQNSVVLLYSRVLLQLTVIVVAH